MIGKKSRLFGSIASRILAGGDSFAITVRAISDSNPVSGQEFHHFVFAGFVPTVAFGSVYHTCLLDIHIQRLAQPIGLQDAGPICSF